MIDTYTITTSTVHNATVSVGGGNSIVATENAQMDGIQTLIPTIVHPDTTLDANVRTTTGQSLGSNETSFSLSSAQAKKYYFRENFFFDKPQLIASDINQTSGTGSKSFFLDMNLGTTVRHHQ